MNTTHTPGPWEAKYQPFSPAHTIGKRASNGSHDLIADLSESVAQLDERQANAHLIAAAPEMLEALKLIVNYQNYTMNFSKVSYELQAALTECVNAIAKAEGRN